MMGALFALANIVQAQDRLAVADVEIPQDGQVSLTVQYQFTEADKYAGCQFNLVLPDGITFVTNAQGNAVYVMGNCYNETPSHGGNLVAGVESFSSNGSYDNFINGTAGTLVTFTIQTSETLTVGETLTGKLQNIVMGSRTAVSTSLEDVSFNITIGEPVDKHIVLDENSTSMPAPATGVDVRVQRTINEDVWSTICLPFAMTEEQVQEAFGSDVQLADFTGYEASEDDDENIVGIKVNFEAVNAIEANHPYIIKVSSPVTEFTVDGVDIDPEEEPTKSAIKRTKKQWSEMIGTYVAETVVEEQMLFLSGGNFWYSMGNTKMKGYRAYFDFYDVLTEVEEAGVRMFVDFGGEQTRIDGIDNGQPETDSVYDLSGRKVSSPQHNGVYIINGKKVLK